MAATTGRPGWMLEVDEAILEELEAGGREYVSFVASRRGLHLKHAERRCRELARRGFLEWSDGSSPCDITPRGSSYLRERPDRS